MPALLRAVAPTPCVTLQDRGRRGWRRFGVTGAGAMDRTGHALANALVGNRAGEVTLEFAYAGGEWLVEAPSCRIAVAGGAFAITIDGAPLAPYTSAVLERGQRLRIGSTNPTIWLSPCSRIFARRRRSSPSSRRHSSGSTFVGNRRSLHR